MVSVELGGWLKKQEVFKHLLTIFESSEKNDTGPVTWQNLVDLLARNELAFNDFPKYEERSAIVASLFAIVAQAKELRSGHAFPLVPSQVQLWVRELRRLGRLVHEKPVFSWLDEPTQDFPSLPVFHCKECGESGWIGLLDPATETPIAANGVTGFQIETEPSKIYGGWFGYKGKRSPHIVAFSPWPKVDAEENAEIRWEDQQTLGYEEQGKLQPDKKTQAELVFQEWYVCPKSLVLRQGDGPCPLTSDPKRFRVRINKDTTLTNNQVVVGNQGCPKCGATDGVFFIGSQSATLSSVAIDEMFGSVLNNDPKLLAFTDSVQDASHRAGFFSSRTYQFTFRTALQHVVDDAGMQGIRLSDAGAALLDWWSQPRPGWRGTLREAMASLMPPDLHEYVEFINYRNGNLSSDVPPKRLRDEIDARLTWEVTSEYGLMLTHGRTMEATGSSCLRWDEERIAATIKKLRDRIPKIDQSFEKIDEQTLRLWIYGFLYRARLRGALDHPFLESFAKQGFWGKYPFKRTITGRETYPSGGSKYRPHLMVTRKDGANDHVLAPTRGGRSPWQVVWARRSLGKQAEEQSILDLIEALLDCGTASGLFKQLHNDGQKSFYAISASAAFITKDRTHLVCSQTEKSLIRPTDEAAVWKASPSWEYFAPYGKYEEKPYFLRQRYYQERYRKGVLRRVVASEHTGLLATEDREQLERDFANTKHADDPNVLTCTSTLEMGIDIGDLSSTMLCSIPPSTASYLQRIGRAGRSTGTALIVSVVNQRPHDLFFFARPSEMLRGKVDPPGCWLDASAVLVRQYLAYGFDSATKKGELPELPKSGKQLVDDMGLADGKIPKMLDWVGNNETKLRGNFLKRLQNDVQKDTRDRFIVETQIDLLRQRMHSATNEFSRMVRDLDNARSRLRSQLSKLDDEEKDARQEIEQELKVLAGRSQSLSRTTALEILSDNGLLPNYAFPERGVRFYGAVYNKHQKTNQEHKTVELTRPASGALRELAPANHFYTHSRVFDIQQIAIGNQQDPLIFTWAICGACGHMRLKEELDRPDAQPACPQCGHDDDSESQSDRGQQRQFLEFSRSQSLSYMEHYESLSADKSDERDREYYQTIRSFDLTKNTPSGAVGDDGLPFGIEYRSSVTMREVNVGYQGEPGAVSFGVDQEAPEEGFQVCRDCGIIVPPDTSRDEASHRRSCVRRRANEKRVQQGRNEQPYNWENVYLYRELNSEAIRLLLPIADDEDIDTLTACLHLGLRLLFDGNPAHLTIAPQIMPDAATGMQRYYVVLMDAVPGGTGYLKSLYQEKDDQGRDGEGILKVLRLALNALETCECRQLLQDPNGQDTDGCYRCVRTFHLQYKADSISREKGITLLKRLIEAGEKRVPQKELSAIKPNSLFGSMLEKKFVKELEQFVLNRSGSWEQTIIRGSQGFRFTLPEVERIWELELQPQLGHAQGVYVSSQPDFLLRSDDGKVKPIVIFTDGFQYHCHPNNRLADDFNKRRSILASGNYHVWNITWDDLKPVNHEEILVSHAPVAGLLTRYQKAEASSGKIVPSSKKILGNGFVQLQEFICTPHKSGWSQLAMFVSYYPLKMLVAERKVNSTEFRAELSGWRTGGDLSSVANSEDGDWVYNNKAGFSQDVITYMAVDDELSNRQSQVITLARLNDGDADVTNSSYAERWRRFLASINLYQFNQNFQFWASSESSSTAPEILLEARTDATTEWKEIEDNVIPSLTPYVRELAASSLSVPESLPEVEHFNNTIDDDAFAELAWPQCSPPVALLAGDQQDFSSLWQAQGWVVVTLDELQARGMQYLIDKIR